MLSEENVAMDYKKSSWMMFVCDCNFEFAKSKYFAIKHTM